MIYESQKQKVKNGMVVPSKKWLKKQAKKIYESKKEMKHDISRPLPSSPPPTNPHLSKQGSDSGYEDFPDTPINVEPQGLVPPSPPHGNVPSAHLEVSHSPVNNTSTKSDSYAKHNTIVPYKHCSTRNLVGSVLLVAICLVYVYATVVLYVILY